MEMIERRIEQLVTGIARAHGGDADLDVRTVFHPVVNDGAATTLAGDVASGLVGEANGMRDLPPGTGSEDFSFMLEEVPGCCLLLGNAKVTIRGRSTIQATISTTGRRSTAPVFLPASWRPLCLRQPNSEKE